MYDICIQILHIQIDIVYILIVFLRIFRTLEVFIRKIQPYCYAKSQYSSCMYYEERY